MVLLRDVGLNKLTAPPSNWLKKTVTYLFGGFGSILFVAAIMVFVAWKPLGDPPALANLALAIVLVLVWLIQAAFSFWQDFSSGRVMASINTMLPDQAMVLREGSWTSVEGTKLVPGVRKPRVQIVQVKSHQMAFRLSPVLLYSLYKKHANCTLTF